MLIGLYTDSDVTGSTYLMAQDLGIELEKLGYGVSIGSKLSKDELGRPDVLLNFIPKDVIKIDKQKRFFFYGKAVTIFSPGIGSFSDPQMAYMLASGVTIPIVAHSPTIYKALLDKAKLLLSPGLRKDMVLDHIPYGVMDIFTFKKKTDDQMAVAIAPFTRCVEEHKQYSKHRDCTIRTAALLAKHGLGMVTRLYHASPKLSHIDKANTDGYEKHDIILDRKDYSGMLQQIGLSISMSDNESFGLYYIELLMSGVIVVFADYPWVHRLLPGYRFIIQQAKIPHMVLKIRQNYDECFAYLEKSVLPFIRNNYLLSSFARTLCSRYIDVK